MKVEFSMKYKRAY